MTLIRTSVAAVIAIGLMGCTYFGASRGTGQFVLSAPSSVDLVYVVPARDYVATVNNRPASSRAALEAHLLSIGSAFRPTGRAIRYAPGNYWLVYFCNGAARAEPVQLAHAKTAQQVIRIDLACAA